MGGRGSSSGKGMKGGTFTISSGAQIDKNKEFSIDFATKYRGTAKEVERADQITAVTLSIAYSRGLRIGTAVNNVEKGLGMYAYDENAKKLASDLKREGYERTVAGATKYYIDNSPPLNFIKSAKTAKEVIDKYGDKVKPEDKPKYRIHRK